MGAIRRSEVLEFEGPWHAHAAAVRRYVAARVPSGEVDDVVAATMATVWRRYDPDEVTNPGAWIKAIALGHIQNSWRSERRRGRLRDQIETKTPRDAWHVCEPGSEVDHLIALLETCTPIERTIVALIALDHRTIGEVAELVGMTPGAVRVRLHRARIKLRTARCAQEAADARDCVAGASSPK